MRKRGLGKRATSDVSHHVYLTVFELILISVIFLSLMSYVKSLEKNSLFERSYLSKDLALLTSTIMASPAKVDYVYTHPKIVLSSYDYFFGDKIVKVTGKSGSPIYYPYADDSNLVFNSASLLAPYAIRFGLIQNNLQIGSASAESTIICPQVATSDPDAKSKMIVIDPGHGLDTRSGPDSTNKGAGFESNGLREQDITLAISSNLQSQLGFQGFKNFKLTRNADQYVSIEDRLQMCSSATVCISIHAGSEPSSYDNVRVYVYTGGSNSLRVEKLACLILKEFAKRFVNISRLEIVRIDSLQQEDHAGVLRSDSVAVLVEIGNMGLKGLLSKPAAELSAPINEAIGKYYE